MSTRLRLFPLNAVLFPGAILNLHVFEPRYKQLLADCMESGEGFGVVLIREGHEAGDTLVQPHDIGTVAKIGDVTQLPFGRYYVSTVGTDRFRIREILSREPYLTVEVEFIPQDDPRELELEDLARQVRSAFDEYLRLVVEFSGQVPIVEVPDNAEGTSFLIGDALQVADTMKQRLLELSSTRQRLTVELGFLRRLLPQLRRLLERRQEQLEAAQPAQEDPFRDTQARYYGKYFSLN
ncbi:MAG: LON peptidase substrate-binding domain-containing protein [Candidatus Eremiobacteraeota bacterium]|nr:LON peptidase substrate-binding domain-containing protein [Candidatus Eremiobacteraeota bacterium]